MDLARPLRAAGIPVCIGGFHVSGCLSMLKTLPPDLVEAQNLGVSFFAGEAEDRRIDEVLRDGFSGSLKSIYNHLAKTPACSPAPSTAAPGRALRGDPGLGRRWRRPSRLTRSGGWSHRVA